MLKKLEVYFLQVIRCQRTGLIPLCLRFTLWVFSWIYQSLIYLRNWGYDIGLFRQYTPPVPVVISIGNLVVGGTGKTPVTLLLAKKFIHELKIAIISRGYRSPAERLAAPIVLSNGSGPMHPASYCGDEPYLLAQNLPEALVIVGKNRQLASNIAAKDGAQVILFDDAMQHRRLARDFDVVVMDIRDPFGQGYFLPRGFLREGSSSLKRAHLVILNHAYDAEYYQRIRKEVVKHTQAPIIGTRLAVTGIFDFNNQSLGSIQDKSVALFCGIANPESFFATVRRIGAETVATITVPDHRPFDWKELATFAENAKKKGAEFLLCTEKDRVRFTQVEELSLPIGWIKTELVVAENEDAWQRFIANVQEKAALHH